MEEEQMINIVILDDDDKPKRYFRFSYEGFLNMPHVGESLIIKLGEGEETKLHELVVTKVEHRWGSKHGKLGSLSSCDNYIYCKYQNDNIP